MKRIIRRRAAREDLVEIAYYYMSNGSSTTARRFREQAESLFQKLAAMPGLGARYPFDHPALAELRFLQITGFEKYLVFYLEMSDGIEIVRILHGARDIGSVLAGELQAGGGN